MILLLAGTHGAGKTSIVYKMMNMYPPRDLIAKSPTGKIIAIGHVSEDTPYGPIFYVGKYTTPTGGCDTVKTQDEVRNRVKKWHKKGHVILEGALLGDCYAKHAEFFKRLTSDYRVCVLDTPFKTALANVNKRRKAAGKTPLENMEAITAKHKNQVNLPGKCADRDIKCEVIRYKHGVEDMLKLLERDNEE